MSSQKTYEWLKSFLSDEPGTGPQPPPPGSSAPPMFQSALQFQELMLDLTRQMIAGEGSRRGLDESPEEMLRSAFELWKPFFQGERRMRKQALEAQSALLDRYAEMLRSLSQRTSAKERERP
jgi:hypothetical protein